MDRIDVLCVFTSIIVGILYTTIIKAQRESSLYWSNLSDVEKEISFRTEQGLYFSYFKESLSVNNIMDVIGILSHNNLTESPKTLNIFQRMNILPEVLLRIMYRWFTHMKPIDFYEKATILLQFWTPFSLLCIIQSISNSLLETLLFAVIFLLNNHAISRIVIALPLRENFALPFWWLRMLALNMILKQTDTTRSQKVTMSCAVIVFALSTSLFCMFWHFSQFVLLIEVIFMNVLHYLGFLNDELCLGLSYGNLLALGLTCFVQAGSLFPITSPCAIILLTNILFIDEHQYSQNRKEISRISGQNLQSSIRYTGKLWGRIGFAVALYGLFSVFIPNEDASHILQFLLHKFHLSNKWDFDTALYLCSPSFRHMDLEKYQMEILNSNLIIPSYICGIVILTKQILFHLIGYHKRIRIDHLPKEPIQKSSITLYGFTALNEDNPTIRIKAWHLAYSLNFGFLAWTTLRMKYLWTPHMLLLAVIGFKQALVCCLNLFVHTCCLMYKLYHVYCDKSKGFHKKLDRSSYYYQKIMKENRKINTRMKVNQTVNIILIVLIISIAYQAVREILFQLSQLSEFYDPDTVELMEWIKSNLNNRSIFTGSMQLMAAIKCCTSRPIANHPHYENAELRRRTKQLYQIYGRKSLDEVYSILRNYSIDYFIIETSICFTKSTGCREADLIDFENNEWPDAWLLGSGDGDGNKHNNNNNINMAKIQTPYRISKEFASRLKRPKYFRRRFCTILINSASNNNNKVIGKTSTNNGLHNFRLVFHNPTFYIFQVLKKY
uniref:Uncharacterized protein n=1 Tax=Trichobilharzia regenti TaxID=157069 RepID=A0AA85J4I9_TRIRE|nr:unnamed protein product [Trichobilharzia regenti]